MKKKQSPIVVVELKGTLLIVTINKRTYEFSSVKSAIGLIEQLLNNKQTNAIIKKREQNIKYIESITDREQIAQK